MNTDNRSIHKLPPKLPASSAEYADKRIIKSKRTLNDMVEDIHLKLTDNNEDYDAFLYAVYDEQAVEGSLSADNTMAASLIREQAKKDGNLELAGQKLATISKALNIVLRRYEQSRKERRNMIGGELLGDNGGD